MFQSLYLQIFGTFFVYKQEDGYIRNEITIC